MSKIDDVKTKLLELTDKSNTTTGENHTNLTSAVSTIVNDLGKS